jgi:hypothetical protein
MDCTRSARSILLALLLVMTIGCSLDESTPVARDTSPDDPVSRDTSSRDTSTPDVSTPDVSTPDVPTPDASSPDVTEPSPWRSALYPEDWTPSHTDDEGRFLHDFSYAGYRLGTDLSERPRPSLTFDVTAFGASADGSADATAAIQQAIDTAVSSSEPHAGAVVYFPAGTYRIDGRLFVRGSGIVLRGEGPASSRLHFTSSAGMSFRAHLTFGTALDHGSPVPLARDASHRNTFVEVVDASAFNIGDDIAIGWVITEDFVREHAMEGVWRAFNGTWQPFFRREIVAIDRDHTPHRIYFKVPLRYPLKVRDQASVQVETGHTTECGLESMGVANAVGWHEAWDNSQVHAVAFEGVKDCWVLDVSSFASPSAPTEGPGQNAHLQSGGLLIRHSSRVTVADSTLAFAQNRGSGGNGYLFEVRQSNEILFSDLVAQAGRHNFIQNWGFGTSGVVWLRVHSLEGKVFQNRTTSFATTGHSEFHHSLAMGNLIDSSRFDDGWSAINRQQESTGSGHTATESVIWNATGSGTIRSYQFGHGYVIGTGPDLTVAATLPELTPQQLEAVAHISPWTGTEPLDWTEGIGRAGDLTPPSLYEDQRRRRRLTLPNP